MASITSLQTSDTLVTRFGKKLIHQRHFPRPAIETKESVNNTTQKERIPLLLQRRLLKGFKTLFKHENKTMGKRHLK